VYAVVYYSCQQPSCVCARYPGAVPSLCAYMYRYWRQNAKKYLWQEKIVSTVTSQKGKLNSHDDCDKSAFRLFSSIIIAFVKTLSTVNSHSSHDRHVTLVIPLELSGGTTDGADQTSNITTATPVQKKSTAFYGSPVPIKQGVPKISNEFSQSKRSLRHSIDKSGN